jgi:hypothetical protein
LATDSIRARPSARRTLHVQERKTGPGIAGRKLRRPARAEPRVRPLADQRHDLPDLLVPPLLHERELAGGILDDFVDVGAQDVLVALALPAPAEHDVGRSFFLHHVQHRVAHTAAHDGAGADAHAQVLGHRPGAFEQLSLALHALLLVLDALLEGGLLRHLDHADGDELRLRAVRGGVPRGDGGAEAEQEALGCGVGHRDDHAVAPARGRSTPFRGDGLADQARLHGPRPGVGEVPGHPDEENAAPDPQHQRSHLRDDDDAGQKPEDRHHRVGQPREAEVRVVGLRLGASHHEDRDVHQRVGHQVREARHVGQRLDPDAEGDEPEDDGPGRDGCC